MDSFGCIVNVVMVVFVFVVDVLEIEGDIGFCFVGVVVFVVEEGYVFYQWSNGMMSWEILVIEEGVYVVIVQDIVGCMNFVEWEIKFYVNFEVDIFG